MDMPASMAALTQQKIEKEGFPDSENVLPALLGQSENAREFLVLAGASTSLRHGIWKTIEPSRNRAMSVNTIIETGCDPAPQVYRLDTDLGEQVNLSETEIERWNRMSAKLRQIRGEAVPAARNVKLVIVEKPECRLEFLFKNDAGAKIMDSSGKENTGIAHGTVPDKDSNGKTFRRFDGKSWIDVQKSPSIAFARTPWTTEVEFKPEMPDGALVSVGASAQGYSLGLEKGKLVFSATVDGAIFRVVSPEPVEGWCKTSAIFSSENKMILYVNSEKVGERNLPHLVSAEPTVAWRIGAMSGNGLGESCFTGNISSVKLSAGEVPPK